jgi:molybdopterin converting factor small subunit
LVIDVHLHTILQRQGSQGRISSLFIDLQEGSTLSVLLQRLELKANTDELLMVINTHTADLNQVLQDGDEVHLIPALSGG